MDQETRQFVIQKHTCPQGTHWDLMLQADQVLWTWRLDCPPELIGDQPIRAEKIFDHPLRFLSYEGPVQNQTGQVCIADQGFFTFVFQKPGELRIELQGRILNGRFTVRQENESIWTFSLYKE